MRELPKAPKSLPMGCSVEEPWGEGRVDFDVEDFDNGGDGDGGEVGEAASEVEGGQKYVETDENYLELGFVFRSGGSRLHWTYFDAIKWILIINAILFWK